MDPLRPNKQLGTVINGIKLVSVIGQGSFAVVFLGKREKQYAVKCLYRVGLTPSQLSLQMSEANILNSLSHPNIIRLLETIETPECVYLVMEYCETDLFDHIMQTDKNEMEAKRLFSQLCQAVDHCHSHGVYHRDLKPENVLLSSSNIKLADFGLATHHSLSNEYGCGSVRYMAPECLSSEEGIPLPYSCAANDVWSLGIILINLLTGKNPWVEPSIKDKHFKVHMGKKGLNQQSFKAQFGFTDELCSLLRSVFHLDPFKRPSALEFSECVNRIPLMSKPKASPPPPLSAPTPDKEDLIFKFDEHDTLSSPPVFFVKKKPRYKKNQRNPITSAKTSPWPSPPGKQSFMKFARSPASSPLTPNEDAMSHVISGMSGVLFDATDC